MPANQEPAQANFTPRAIGECVHSLTRPSLPLRLLQMMRSLAYQPPPTAKRTRAGTRWLACLLTVQLAACSGAEVTSPAAGRRGIEVDLSGPERYAAALRLAALARVEARAGEDPLAAEHFRNAYRLQQAVPFLVAYAQAAERAGLFAEAHDALRRLLGHALSEDQRKIIETQEKRVAALVPPGLQRVAVLVSPDGARVEMSREGTTKRNGPERMLIGSGDVFLQPGTWNLETGAKGFNSELRTVQVGPPETNVVAIELQLEDQGPALVGTPNARQPRQIDKRPIPLVQDKKPDPPKGPTLTLGEVPQTAKRGFIATWGPIATTGLGVLVVGAGGWFGYQTQVAANDIAAVQPGGSDYVAKNLTTNQQTQLDSVHANQTLANYAFIGGGALVAIGSLWWLLQPAAQPEAPVQQLTEAPRPPTPSVLPVPTVSGRGAALTWKF